METQVIQATEYRNVSLALLNESKTNPRRTFEETSLKELADLLFVIERLVSVLDESRVEMLARQHGIRQKRDDGGLQKTLNAFLRRADEGTLSRLLVEACILLAASRGNPSTVLKEAATAYTVDTDAIAAKVRQEFAAKEKAKKASQPAAKIAKKAA
jgi:ParB family chromosome partitioning protein